MNLQEDLFRFVLEFSGLTMLMQIYSEIFPPTRHERQVKFINIIILIINTNLIVNELSYIDMKHRARYSQYTDSRLFLIRLIVHCQRRKFLQNIYFSARIPKTWTAASVEATFIYQIYPHNHHFTPFMLLQQSHLITCNLFVSPAFYWVGNIKKIFKITPELRYHTCIITEIMDQIKIR